MALTFFFYLFTHLGQIMDQQTLKGQELAEATFAGGCFWCMEGPFDQLPGVKDTIVGYTGGAVADPSYEQVNSGTTGHTESVLVVYNPKEVSYEKLLETFWKNIDPTQVDGQFADRGSQYRTAIFFHNEEQKKLAEASKEKLASSGKFKKPIATTIEPASTFYRAEEYHQDYYKKNSIRYKLYRVGSGRADYIKRTWGEE
jgi:methionine-S-sulfoxide reductase